MPLSVEVIGCSDGCDESNNLSVNLGISQGETISTQFQILDGDPLAPIYLYNIAMQINFPTPIMLTSQGSNPAFDVVDHENAIAQLDQSSDQTNLWPVGQYAYDLWTIDANNAKMRIINGVFTVLQSVY